METLTERIRACTARRRHRKLRAPEYRALEQIVAEAEREGRQVVILGPSGILEVTGNMHHRGTEDTERNLKRNLNRHPSSQ